MYKILAGPNGYSFPPQNICVLLDKNATVSGVKTAMEQLISRIQGPDDEVLIYYSGHGSQADDLDGDEPDGKDETLVLHDSRTRGLSDLLDDELAGYLDSIHKKTKHVVTIFDSCHSGSVTRGPEDEVVARWAEPSTSRLQPQAATAEKKAADHGESWTPFYSDLVQLSGATDGTLAQEPRAGGNGYFTAALVEALSEVSTQPRTWGQISRQVMRSVEVSSRKQQVPRFQGALDRVVFSVTERTKPQTWEISSLEENKVKLTGLPTPGFGPGALLTVYPAALSAAELRDPGKSIATLEVLARGDSVFEAVALIHEQRAAPVLGDRAVMTLASRDQHRTGVTLSLTPETKASFLRELAANTRASAMFSAVEKRGDFELSESTGGDLVLTGSDGLIRNLISREQGIGRAITVLENHTRQVSLLSLTGEPGGDFKNDETLRVEFIKAPGQQPCAKTGWRNACTGEIQDFPLCTKIEIKVTNTHPRISLYVGGVVLFNDGEFNGVPSENNIILPPGRSATIGTILTGTPYNIVEHVMIFGTQQDNIVPWGLVASGDGTRGERDSSPLQNIIGDYLGGTRSEMIKAEKRSTWTSTHRAFRVVPNPAYAALGSGCAQSPDHDRTAAGFDLDPYLPANENSALSTVLRGTLTATPIGEGAIAALFESSAPGNKDFSGTLFERCDRLKEQTGDVLVFRGADRENKPLTFAALLLDPERRLVWSRGPYKEGVKEMGFDQIPSDLRTWNMTNAKRTACHRLKKFAGEPENIPRYLVPQTLNCNKERCTK